MTRLDANTFVSAAFSDPPRRYPCLCICSLESWNRRERHGLVFACGAFLLLYIVIPLAAFPTEAHSREKLGFLACLL